MRNKAYEFLAFSLIILYVSILMFFGVYSFDLPTVMQFVAAAIFATILSYTALIFSKRPVLTPIYISQGFSRQLTLQRVDPLLC